MRFHDLSANTVRIDYPTLLKTAQIAVRGALMEVERRVSEVHNRRAGQSVSLNAEWLAESADDLAVAIETLEALEAMKSRSELTWTNKPKVMEF